MTMFSLIIHENGNILNQTFTKLEIWVTDEKDIGEH